MIIHSVLQTVGSVYATAKIATTVLQGCYVTYGSVRTTLRRKEVVKQALCIMVLVYVRHRATLSTWNYRALPCFLMKMGATTF